MRIIKYSILVLTVMLVAGIGIILLAPAMVARPLLANYLQASGFELTAFDGLSIAMEQTSIAEIAMRNSSLQLSAGDTALTYSLSELLRGSLRGITINSLEVELLPESAATPAAASNAAETLPLSEQINATLQTLGSLPLANLKINAIEVRSADTSLDLALQIETQPLQIAGTIASSQFADMQLQINAGSDGDAITGQASVLQNRETVIQTEFKAAFIADAAQLEVDASISMDIMPALVGTFPIFATLTSTTESVSLALQITAEDLRSSPSLSLVDLVLDNPDHSLQISQQAEQRQSEVLLQLPLHWVGAMPALDQSLQLAADAVQASINVTDGGTQAHSTITLTNTRVGCSLDIECTGTANLTAQVPLLRTASISAQDLDLAAVLTMSTTADGFTMSIPELTLDNGDQRLLLVDSDTSLQFALAANSVLLSCNPALLCTGSGAFDFSASELDYSTIKSRDVHAQGNFTLGYSADGFDITLPATELAVPSLRVNDSEVSVTLALSDLSAHIGAHTSVSVIFATEHLDPGLADVQLRNPSITGNMSYAGDTLDATLNLALANQLQFLVNAAFSASTQSGQLNWEIPPYYFSSITPLSALITQSLLEMDIVAGSLAGSGSMDFAADAAGEWQTSGPVAVELNEISGFVADTVFVGLNSSIQAAHSGTGDIHSTNFLSARIATLDVGLPLTDIRWSYSFDSAAQNITFKDLVINTLGGEITMAEFSYDIQNPDSTMIVVLTNLNLQSIVDLAEYPGIRVEGLISGYLPLTLKGNTLTVEKGLIGALQPGGTIRYDSGGPALSGNATLDLVNEALANYHYQIMNSYVYYNDNGDLHLEMQLLGNNPDLYNGQMVNLNVNIDDNIPSLLRSLQASRTITDALELRLRNRRPSGNSQGM